jgi:hypothetical protein
MMPRGQGQSPVLAVIAVFALLVVIVNPLREIMTRDDGWAYARTVEHLLNSGQYRLDAWAAANMPVQIYLAAGMAKVFGYSLTLLRICTLSLFLAGSIAFYLLLREFEISRSASAAFTIVLMCSPLVVWLGFTFMTDVQFLGWVLLASWVYARGLQRHSRGMIFLGSLLAALATGTRQFGIALPLGLVLGWMVTPRRMRFAGGLIVSGTAAPVFVFLWQLWAARQHANFTQSVRLIEQSLHFSQSLLQIALQVVWRFGVVVEYAGLFLAALSPVLLVLLYRSNKACPQSGGTKSHWFRRPEPASYLFVWVGCLVAVHVFSMIQAHGGLANRFKAGLMPQIPWVIATVVLPDRIRYQLVLTAVTLASAATLSAYLFRPWILNLFWHGRNAGGCFLAGTATAFVALHLLYVQFQDTYMVVFLPFVLLAVAHVLQKQEAPAAWIRGIAGGAAILGFTFALWMRGDLNRQEALWRTAEGIYATRGVKLLELGGNLTWLTYHGAFDRWITELGPSIQHKDYAGRLYLFFYWINEKRNQAEYILYASENERPPVAIFENVGQVAYRDGLFRKRSVYVAKRRQEVLVDSNQARGPD